MTKKTENATKTAAEKAAEAVDATETKIADRVTEGARELVKRSTATAKERADDAFVTTKKYNADLENMLVRAARGYTNILGNIAEAAFVNVNRGIMTAEKLAEAKSLQEAVTIQTEYVREQSTCSIGNARAAFEYIRDVATENGAALRDTATKAWKSEKAA
ncbi:phasin family protein [Sulfitobacter sp. HNIBRBA3233]|uniref:phasin family protein n=1 Tax=Sulfitobacter marinivivus TaxID=3158558 RepID=UPI0032DE3FCD